MSMPSVLPADPPPPELLRTPELSTFQTPSDFGQNYIRSTHVFPAAWPRDTPYIPAPTSAVAPADEKTQAKKERGTRVMEELIALKKEHEEGRLQVSTGKEQVLWICAYRYARKRASVVGKGKTVICTHANGMHKALFEPLLRHLFSLRDDVDEVWALDCVQHGDSALLNESADLGSLFDWSDLVRDVLCFLQYYLPQELCIRRVPYNLRRLPTALAQKRLREGLEARTLFALGHSFGGTALTLAARACPLLFNTLILADPVIFPKGIDTKTYDFLRAFIPHAVLRRNTWANRGAALADLKPKRPFKDWNDEVVNLHIEYGLVETSNGDVHLKCKGFQEAVVYIEHSSAHEAWNILPDIDERVAIHWIVPPADRSIVQAEDLAAERLHRRLINTSYAVLPGAMHLLIQSHPLEVAEEVHKLMQSLDNGQEGSGSEQNTKAKL